MKLGEAVTSFLKNYQLPDGKLTATGKSYRESLTKFCAALGPNNHLETITKIQIKDYCHDLSQASVIFTDHPRRRQLDRPPSPQTLRRHLKTIRFFLKWCDDHDLTYKNLGVVIKIPSSLPRITHTDLPTDSEINALRSYFYGQWRNSALFGFLVDTGCRAGEVASLRLDCLDLSNREALVTGKFSKQRHVWFTESTYDFFVRWLKSRSDDIPYAFPVTRQRKSSDLPHLAVDSVSGIIKRACKSLGLRPLYAHMFRYRKASDLANSQVDDTFIMKIMGHSSIEITRRSYIKLEKSLLQRASNAAIIPFPLALYPTSEAIPIPLRRVE